MTTVQQIVDGAAEEIGVKTAEIPLQPADFQAILNRMNDMGAEWADSGLTPAFIEKLNRTDTVNIDRNAVAAFKYNLALRLASPFQRVISDALALSAKTTLQKLEASVIHIGDVAYPDSLPTGSGNDCGSIFTEDRFFPSNSDENF